MILNRQERVCVAVPALEAFSRRVKRELRLNGREVSVCLVSDSEMKRLNRTYRRKNKPTDVLSFPVLETENRKAKNENRKERRQDAGSTFLGDIAIAPAVARRNAKRDGRTLDDELRILILHGVLHLMGYDHETDSGQMERREHVLRRRLGLE